MNFGVILAGGFGSRMGETKKPKQYLQIQGKPIIIHTIEKFLLSDKIDAIIVMCPKQWMEYTESICDEYFFDRKVSVAAGGETRNETIINAIDFIEKGYGLDDKTTLITHDSVRPFVNIRIIEDNINAISNGNACTTAVPATDTIFISRDGVKADNALRRNCCYQVQTPQSFFAIEFKKCYNELSSEQKGYVTDAMGVFLLNDYEVHLIMGRSENIKITYQSDMYIAESIFELENNRKNKGTNPESW